MAVVGDGALTGGVAFEALHNAGGPGRADRDRPERQRHVDRAERRRAVALLQPHPAQPKGLHNAREEVETALTKLPAGIGERIERLGPQLKESIKAFWAPGLFFEELDLAYVGVIDGHDVGALREALARGARGRPPGGRARARPSRARASRPPRRAASRAWRSGTRPSRRRSSTARAAPPKPKAVGRAAARPPPQYTKVFGDALVRGVPRATSAWSASPPR